MPAPVKLACARPIGWRAGFAVVRERVRGKFHIKWLTAKDLAKGGGPKATIDCAAIRRCFGT